MDRILKLIMAMAVLALPVAAAKLSNVKVDLLKGYYKAAENGVTSYYYMGAITYTFLAEGKDSVFIDFVVKKQGTEEKLEIVEKTGDVGLIKQLNPGDTNKIMYFRAKIAGEPAPLYVATVKADAEMSVMLKKADSLVGLMTYEQQQSTLYLSWAYNLFGAESFKLPDNSMMVGWRSADGPHGIRYPIGPPNDVAIYGAGDPVTLFPTEAAMGCSWDTSLVNRIGAAIGREARAMGLYCNLGPMCDLVINPRWGRAFETVGEDPYLNGKIASRMVLGLQSEKVVATPKHFVPYIKETERTFLRLTISERTLRELFCVPFEMAIRDANARALMTCYNRVRVPGYTVEPTPTTVNCDRASTTRHNIEDILRRDWGFDGVIMTDWEGSKLVDDKWSYETDYDMSCPLGDGGFTNIARNIKAGIWSAEPLKKKARRVMYAKLWASGGKLLTNDNEINNYPKPYPKSTILCQDHLQLALEAARKTLTLVKNDPVDNAPILPLNKNGAMKIAVVGPYAAVGRQGGGGSSAVTPDSMVTILQGIKNLTAGNANISVVTDYTNADVAVVCVGVSSESEDKDRPDMMLPSNPIDQNGLVGQVMAKVKKTIVVYTGGSASVPGNWSKAPAVLIAFYPGRWQGKAIAEVLFGDVNPGGHLSVTFPASVSDLPSFELTNYEMTYPSADTAHGYFYFEKTGKKPLFWFGHGLSYTTFKYNGITVKGGKTSISSNDRVDIEVWVENTGSVAGDEVVQLYVKPLASAIPRRVKDLRGFARISLEPNKYQAVRFTLGPRDFSIYMADPAKKAEDGWKVVPGVYEIIAGSTSDPEELVNGNGKCVKTLITVQ